MGLVLLARIGDGVGARKLPVWITSMVASSRLRVHWCFSSGWLIRGLPLTITVVEL